MNDTVNDQYARILSAAPRRLPKVARLEVVIAFSLSEVENPTRTAPNRGYNVGLHSTQIRAAKDRLFQFPLNVPFEGGSLSSCAFALFPDCHGRSD